MHATYLDDQMLLHAGCLRKGGSVPAFVGECLNEAKGEWVKGQRVVGNNAKVNVSFGLSWAEYFWTCLRGGGSNWPSVRRNGAENEGTWSDIIDMCVDQCIYYSFVS